MISLNKHFLRDNRGSALVVTILLVSVMLTAALILLQRIIPYAKNVRWMNDAVQSYYTARGEVESGRLGFFYTWGGNEHIAFRLPSLFGLLSDFSISPVTTGRTGTTRTWADNTPRQNIEDFSPPTAPNTTIKIVELGLPYLTDSTRRNRDYAVSSVSPEIPLKIKLFATDALPKYFGTSKRNPAYHTLDPNSSGGLRFDFRGVKTITPPLGLEIKFSQSSPSAQITIKMQYSAGETVKTFTSVEDIRSSSEKNITTGSTGSTQTIKPDGSIDAQHDQTLGDFLWANNCAASAISVCSLSLTLSGTTSPVDFQLISTGTSPVSIPDLNAVVIGDGLSDNGLYYQRVMELIPTPQDI